MSVFLPDPRATVPPPTIIPVEDASQVGEARRAATALAGALGFDEVTRGRVALVATEAAGNLAKHAQHGVLIVQTVCADGTAGGTDAIGPRAVRGRSCPAVELIAVDRGPGMVDPAHCQRDGFSTAGTPGTGLGAIQRTADLFDIDSHPGRGTVLVARVWPRRDSLAPAPPPPALEVGAVCVPLAGERVCGDAWALVADAERAMILVADGLGHGVDAAVAAEAATRTFVDMVEREGVDGPTLADVLERVHGALRATRGAAVGVALLPRDGALRFAGIGNIAGSLLSTGIEADGRSATRSLVSHNGIVGHQMRTPHEFAYDCAPGTLLVLASDGVRAHWKLDGYPGLTSRHPSIVAATLWRDFSRGRDDATVVVIRASGAGGRA